LIYFARSAGPTDIEGNVGEDKVGWYGLEDWDGTLPNLEVRSWCEKALSTVDNLD
jgi:hypothetical protein